VQYYERTLSKRRKQDKARSSAQQPLQPLQQPAAEAGGTAEPV